MKSIKNLTLAGRVALCSLMLALTALPSALAQDYGDVSDRLLGGANTALQGVFISAIGVVQIALGLGALVTLVMTIFNVIKGEREAAQKVAWWVVGLGLGFAFITVLRSIFG